MTTGELDGRQYKRYTTAELLDFVKEFGNSVEADLHPELGAMTETHWFCYDKAKKKYDHECIEMEKYAFTRNKLIHKFPDADWYVWEKSKRMSFAEADAFFKETFQTTINGMLDGMLSWLAGETVLDMFKFDTLLHEKHGNYEEQGLSMEDVLRNNYGETVLAKTKSLLEVD